MKAAHVARALSTPGDDRRAPARHERETSGGARSVRAMREARGSRTARTARDDERARVPESPPRALPPATAPRSGPAAQPMLHVDGASGAITDRRVAELPALLRRGDVVVLNDAATIPASLRVRAAGRELELRLLGERADGTWRAVLFGEGSWRDDTDTRPAPPRLRRGDDLCAHDHAPDAPRRQGRAWPSGLHGASALLEAGPTCAHSTRTLDAVVVAVDPESPRLIDVRFAPDGDAFWAALYRLGRPVQYSYLRAPLSLGVVQTPYAGRPFAVEVPSAGRPLTLALLEAMRRAGAIVASLTHAAGLSATGDPDLDARLPLPERFVIPARTADAIAVAKAEGHRVIAVGTSVTRALEGSARAFGAVRAGEAETDLRLGASSSLRVVDAILTGAHDPSSSHHDLLRAFAPAALLERAVDASIALGYRGHELGDSWLLT